MFGIDYLSLSAANWHNAVVACGETMVAANEVIWLRSVQMMTGTLSPSEAVTMVVEKPATFAQAAFSAGEAASLGGDLSVIAGAAISPLLLKVHSNATRLRG